MFYFEILFIVVFLVFTIVGYRKHNRNMMLAGSLCLVIATATGPLIEGFNDGFSQATDEHRSNTN